MGSPSAVLIREDHTQLSANYTGALGGANVAVNAASGLKPGMGANGDTFGILTLAGTGRVFDARQVVMNVRLRFLPVGLSRP